MKLNINEIGPKGFFFERQLGWSEVTSLLAQVGVQCEGESAEAHVVLRIKREDKTIFVNGAIKGRYNVACVRCLGIAQVNIDEPEVQLIFEPMSVENSEDIELTADDLIFGVYDGVELDLEPVIRDCLVTAMPIAPVCRPDCAGVCAGCDAILNEEQCRCVSKEKGNNKWADALKKISKTMS